jgi:glutaredoxin
LRPEPEPVLPAEQAPTSVPSPGVTVAQNERHAPDILMYVMKRCGYCTKARAYFNSRGLAWREIDIDASNRDYETFKRSGGTGTPLIFIDGNRVQGYNRARIDAVLRQVGA